VADLLAVYAVGQLRKHGWSLDKAFLAVEAIRAAAPDGELPPDCYLVMTDGKAAIATDPADFSELLRQGGAVVPLSIPLVDGRPWAWRLEQIPA
jgi:hypothetical protein